MVNGVDFLIHRETPFSKKLRNVTNSRGDAYVWRTEPTIGAMNVGAPDLNVAFVRGVFLVEVKVKSVPIRGARAPALTPLFRTSQVQFMRRLNVAGVYGFLALGYIRTGNWDLIPVITEDGRNVKQIGETIMMRGSFDLAYAISQSLQGPDNV